MAYSDFTLRKALDQFDLSLEERSLFTEGFTSVEPGEALSQYLALTLPAAAIGSEKVRSEGIVYPLLVEVRRLRSNQISVFSGEDFTVDSSVGLNGICDFLVCRSPLISVIAAPIVAIVEAKKSDITLGLGQCVAEMVAAQRFNRENELAIEAISGVVTTGTQWRYLSLIDQTVRMDIIDYPLQPIGETLGRLLSLIRC